MREVYHMDLIVHIHGNVMFYPGQTVKTIFFVNPAHLFRCRIQCRLWLIFQKWPESMIWPSNGSPKSKVSMMTDDSMMTVWVRKGLSFRLFLGVPVNDGAFEGVSCWCDRAPVTEIYGTICIGIGVKEVVIFLCLFGLRINRLEETLNWTLIFSKNIIPCIHNRFTLEVHEVSHAVSEGEKCWLCWIIHISTLFHSKILNIIACLNFYVHDITKPVIKWIPMLFFNLFYSFKINGVATKRLF